MSTQSAYPSAPSLSYVSRDTDVLRAQRAAICKAQPPAPTLLSAPSIISKAASSDRPPWRPPPSGCSTPENPYPPKHPELLHQPHTRVTRPPASSMALQQAMGTYRGEAYYETVDRHLRPVADVQAVLDRRAKRVVRDVPEARKGRSAPGSDRRQAEMEMARAAAVLARYQQQGMAEGQRYDMEIYEFPSSRPPPPTREASSTSYLEQATRSSSSRSIPPIQNVPSDGSLEITGQGVVWVPKREMSDSDQSSGKDEGLVVNIGQRAKERKLVQATVGNDGHLYHDDDEMSEICRQLGKVDFSPLLPPKSAVMPQSRRKIVHEPTLTLFDEHKAANELLQVLLYKATEAADLADKIRQDAVSYVRAYGRGIAEGRGGILQRAIAERLDRLKSTIHACVNPLEELAGSTTLTHCLPYDVLIALIKSPIMDFDVSHVIANIPLRPQWRLDGLALGDTATGRGAEPKSGASMSMMSILALKELHRRALQRAELAKQTGMPESIMHNEPKSLIAHINVSLWCQFGRMYYIATQLIRYALRTAVSFGIEDADFPKLRESDRDIASRHQHTPMLRIIYDDQAPPLISTDYSSGTPVSLALAEQYYSRRQAERAVLGAILREGQYWDQADTALLPRVMGRLDEENLWAVKVVKANRRCMLAEWHAAAQANSKLLRCALV